MERASPGCSSGSLQPNRSPPSSSRQYSPAPMSNTIGMRSTANAGCASSTATEWRAAPAGIRSPASRPTSRSDGPPVSSDTLRRDRAGVGLDPDHPGSVEAKPPERRPLAQLHARCLHRERVRPDVPRRVDRAVRGQEAAPAMTGRRERRDGLDGLLARKPADVEPLAPLHRDALAPGPFVVVGHREDQVAELAEARIRPIGRLLAAVERDGPAAERDRGRRAALRPDDARRAGRGAHPDEAALEDDDAPETRGLREHRRPAADRPAADDDQVCRIRSPGRPPYPISTRAATPTWSLG